MITFEELSVSSDGQRLVINAAITDATYGEGFYITQVTVCTESQLSTTTLSLDDDTEYIYQESYDADDAVTSISLELDSTSMNENFTATNMKSNMFFVFVEWDGTASTDIPCGADTNPDTGITYYQQGIFNTAMRYTKKLCDSCTVSNAFIDFILLIHALDISLSTGHYADAIKFWKRLNSISDSSTSTSSTCSCYG